MTRTIIILVTVKNKRPNGDVPIISVESITIKLTAMNPIKGRLTIVQNFVRHTFAE